MHAIFFGLKRAYQSTLRITRRALKRFRLTAARFDLLYAILQHPMQRVIQKDLCETLGVTAPTVSRMVTSLEKLGFVRRERGYGDRRVRWIVPTDEGLRVLRRARTAFIRSGWVQLAVDTALGGERWWDRDWCFPKIEALECRLLDVRREYRDTAWVHYPWCRDE